MSLFAGISKFLFYRTKGLMYYGLELATQNFSALVGSVQLMGFYPVRMVCSLAHRCMDWPW